MCDDLFLFSINILSELSNYLLFHYNQSYMLDLKILKSKRISKQKQCQNNIFKVSENTFLSIV